ncbi:MAG TPA: hypothetical protein VHZ78_12950 [Rhizomicrobium sp.]|jgi:hypothetical protein|nr:hypothetical protein [Rhizomicrobium sp.]
MHAVLRARGLSAIAGGVLRIADSFTATSLSATTLEVLYFVTDVFLLAGIFGLWWQRRAALGIAGMVGLTVFVLGILTIRVSALGVLGTGGYRMGAAVALLGLAIYASETLLRRNAAPWAPVLWLLSLAAGIVGATGVLPEAMTAVAGVLFGAGFVAAGIESLTPAPRMGA